MKFKCIYAQKINTGRPHRYCTKKDLPIYDVEGICGKCELRKESEDDGEQDNKG